MSPFIRLGCLLVAGLSASVVAADHALVIGVNHCPDFRLADGTQPRPLRGAENDADAMADLLTNHLGFQSENVRLLKGQAATQAAVQEHLQTLAKSVTTKDRFVLHFSGHGTQIADAKPFDESDDQLDEALCLFDSMADGRNLLIDDDLGRFLDNLSARQILVFLDCCHSGTGIKDDSDLTPRFLPVATATRGQSSGRRKGQWNELNVQSKSLVRRQLAAFFACQSDQQAYERRFLSRPPKYMGQFSHFLIQGIVTMEADEDADGNVSAQESIAFVQQQLRAVQKSAEASTNQTPRLQSTDSGIVLFSPNAQEP